MHVIDVIILVGWAVFWVFWFAAAIGVKAGKNRWGQFAGIRVLAILVFLLVFHLRVFKGNGSTSNPWLQGIGTAIFVSGWGWPSGPGSTSAGTGACRCPGRPIRNS
jgi:hypothetical protein